MVVRTSLTRVGAASKRDASDAASIEEGSELLDFAAFVAEDEDLGEPDGARACCALCMHEGVFCPHATDTVFDVRTFIPASPSSVFCAKSLGEVMQPRGRKPSERRVVARKICGKRCRNRRAGEKEIKWVRDGLCRSGCFLGIRVRDGSR